MSFFVLSFLSNLDLVLNKYFDPGKMHIKYRWSDWNIFQVIKGGGGKTLLQRLAGKTHLFCLKCQQGCLKYIYSGFLVCAKPLRSRKTQPVNQKASWIQNDGSWLNSFPATPGILRSTIILYRQKNQIYFSWKGRRVFRKDILLARVVPGVWTWPVQFAIWDL